MSPIGESPPSSAWLPFSRFQPQTGHPAGSSGPITGIDRSWPHDGRWVEAGYRRIFDPLRSYDPPTEAPYQGRASNGIVCVARGGTSVSDTKPLIAFVLALAMLCGV